MNKLHDALDAMIYGYNVIFEGQTYLIQSISKSGSITLMDEELNTFSVSLDKIELTK